jgi:hypothetical protein
MTADCSYARMPRYGMQYVIQGRTQQSFGLDTDPYQVFECLVRHMLLHGTGYRSRKGPAHRGMPSNPAV